MLLQSPHGAPNTLQHRSPVGNLLHRLQVAQRDCTREAVPDLHQPGVRLVGGRHIEVFLCGDCKVVRLRGRRRLVEALGCQSRSRSVWARPLLSELRPGPTITRVAPGIKWILLGRRTLPQATDTKP